MEETLSITLNEKLIERITESIKEVVREELPKYKDHFQSKWLTTDEVMDMLKVERRTVQNYRSKGILSYTRLTDGGKILHSAEEIATLLLKNLTKKAMKAGTARKEKADYQNFRELGN